MIKWALLFTMIRKGDPCYLVAAGEDCPASDTLLAAQTQGAQHV